MSQTDKIDIILNEFDSEGTIVDRHGKTITGDEASDIIDHAAQAIIIRRNGGKLDDVLNELEEALTVSGVL